jgi:hypothetical protein
VLQETPYPGRYFSNRTRRRPDSTAYPAADRRR